MDAVLEALNRVRVGEPATFRALSIFPLLADVAGEPDYITLDEALARACGHVSEVSAGGSVPELKFTNEGAQPVLLLDGEELVGAKQNRVLNLSILVPARTSLVIPVSCVEAGRWSSGPMQFSASPRALFAASRAKKTAQVSLSMQFRGQRWSDQREVWSDIEEKMARLDAGSPTSAMSDIFEQRATDLEAYVRAISAADGQVGAVFAINGRVFGCDLFDYPATFRKLFPKLVRSYSLDALEAAGSAPAAPSPRSAEEFLQQIREARADVYRAVGMGEDVRLTGPRLTGAALVAAGRVVHLNAFRLEEAGRANPVATQARMSRASYRRGLQ